MLCERGVSVNHPTIYRWVQRCAPGMEKRLLDKTNTAYRSKANEDFMEKKGGGFVSKVHRKNPDLKPMSRHIQRSNAGKSVIRSRVEHVFAFSKNAPVRA